MQEYVRPRTQKAVWLDFETFFSEEYSLRKMTPIEYILDPRFEALGCAFVLADGTSTWVDGPDLPWFFENGLDLSDLLVVSHNANFDALILARRFNVYPLMYGDTLSMARNWLSHALSSHSLENISKHYGMPAKWDTTKRFKGMSLAMIKTVPELYAELKGYAIDDAQKCRQLFIRWMAEGFPPTEMEVIDWVVRMVTQPQLEFDRGALATYLAEVKAKKQALLDAAFLDKENLSSIMSDAQLATKLLMLGVCPVPMKTSKTTGKQAYAFAKTDKEFQALREHEEPMVQALVEARLGHKSTIEETRTERLLAISNFTISAPVPLKYSGAHTHRFSGDWKINLQNLQRGGKLRYALKAPKGKIVVAIDASQIEARFNATLAGQADLIEQFRRGEDVYAIFAYDIYGYTVDKYKFPRERFVGKTGILSLGYGSSPPVFQNMCRVQGQVNLTDAEATSIVMIYRQKMKQIVANWKHAGNVILPRMAGVAGEAEDIVDSIFGGDPGNWQAWGPLAITRQAIILPDGNRLRYRDLRREFDREFGTQWVFMRGSATHRIYGAKLVENVIQALAFVHIKQVAMRVRKMTEGLLLPAHQVHDELIYVVDENLAEQVSRLVVDEMSKAPEWMPHVPLAAEAHIGPSYGAAK